MIYFLSVNIILPLLSMETMDRELERLGQGLGEFSKAGEGLQQPCFPGPFNHESTRIILRLQRLTLSHNHINDRSLI